MKRILTVFAFIVIIGMLFTNCGSSGGGSSTNSSGATLVSIAVTPTNPSIAKDTNQQFTASGTFSDNTTQDLTATVTWTSSDTTKATITSTGLATGAGVGSVTITAASGSIIGTTTLTITNATLVSIAVTPINPSIALGTTQQFTATGIYSDYTTQNLTTTVTWSSSGTAIATISNAAGFNGLAASVGAGSTTVTATSGSISGSTTLKVTSATLISLALTPVNPTIVVGSKKQFTATGTFSDNTTQDLTALASWSSSSLFIATISNAAGSNGLVTSLATGTTTIAATWVGASNSTLLTVNVTLTVNPTDVITYISDLPWVGTPTNGWGPVEKDMSNGEQAAGDGHTITLNGTTYAKGLGVHAASVVTYNIGGNYSRFVSDIGVDTEVGTAGSVVFQVWADGVKLFDSGTMTGASATQHVDVDVTGKTQLQLMVNIGATISNDHADWAGAYLVSAAPVIKPTIEPGSSRMSFSATVGTNPPDQTMTLSNSGGGTMNWTATADSSSPAWLSVSPGSGTGDAILTASVNIAGLTAGTYNKTIDITATGATNTQQVVNVFLRVQPVGQANLDWLMYGYDNARTGFNPVETTIGVGNAKNLHLLWSFDLGAVTITQPTVAAGVMINGAPTDILYMGSEHGDLYALNAGTGALIWHKNLGSQQTSCGDMPDGVFGISGTPTLDRFVNLLYIVGGDGMAHALNLKTGAEAQGWPVPVTNDPADEHVYGGVNVLDNRLYAEIASYCDYNQYYGRVVLIDFNQQPRVAVSWYPSGGLVAGGGIWGPGGVSIDTATGDVFTATGNALFTPENYLFSENVVELSSSLVVLGANYPGLFGGDVDFGATPVLFQAPGCLPMVAAKNKTGVFVVYTQGQVSNGPIQRLQIADVSDDNFNGIPAWDPFTNMLYIGNSSDSSSDVFMHGMVALKVQSNCTLGLAWQQTVGPNLSSVSPPTVANGVVYYGDGLGNTARAFDAVTGAQLWNSGATITGGIYGAPTIVNGKVYVGSWDHKIYAFGP
jgi:outer membrane protein assembly factor BamB